MTLWTTFATLGLACLLLAAVGCGAGPSDEAAPASAAVETVPECRQYEAALGACFHRSVSVADHPSLRVASNADRTRLRTLCLENLQRIKSACR